MSTHQQTRKPTKRKIVIFCIDGKYLDCINKKGVICTSYNITSARLYYFDSAQYHEAKQHLEAKRRAFDVLNVKIE